MDGIWTPPSYRMRGSIEARKAAQDYDPNLDFGMNQETGQWCIYLKRGTMAASKDKDLPILGFKEIPSRDEVMKRLYQSDALRRGMEIMDDLQRHNDDLEKDYSDVDGQLAEAFEFGFRGRNDGLKPTFRKG
jgi:hypothetical protein